MRKPQFDFSTLKLEDQLIIGAFVFAFLLGCIGLLLGIALGHAWWGN